MRRGHVLKRGKSWCVVVELPNNPVTGDRVQKWHSGYRTRKEAERDLVRLLKKVDDGTYVTNSKQTVAEFMGDWLPAIESTVRPSTLHSYARNLKLHVLPHIGMMMLSRVDAGTLNGLYASLLSAGRRDGSGGLSPRSVRYIHSITHRAFKDAVRWGRLARNPADGADPPRTSAGNAAETECWTAANLGSFLEAVSGDRLYGAFYLLATTGMRRGEALGLRWADVDLEKGRAAIRQTVIAVDHQVQIGSPKTVKGRRVVSLDARTVTVLRVHRQRQLEERLAIGAGWQDRDLLFTKVTGGPLHPERFSREFDRRVERYGLPRITLHGLRHTWATLALEAGVHPKVVSERLGHANIAITLDIYSHATPAMHTDAAETVAGLVFGARR
jgi:integrase